MLVPDVSRQPAGVRVDARGFPAADRRVEWAARGVTIAATVFVAIAVCWGIAAPIGSGHVAALGARGIVAENMWDWGILAPVREYYLSRPTPAQYYSHHPWGMFWAVAAFFKLFGRYDFVCRLPAALMTIASVPMLWGIGRAVWGPVAGALAASGFAVVPIALAFGSFSGFEVPVIFGTVLFTWTYVRFSQTWSKKWLAANIVALAWTVCSGWEAFVFLGIVLAVLALAGLLLPPGWYGTVDNRRFGQWWVLASSITVVGGVGWIGLFHHYGHLEDLLGSHSVRTAGNEASLEQVLDAREHWIELMFTPLAVLIGKLAVPVLALRLLFGRKLLEIFPLAILVMCVFRYLHFKQGADVHIFWPHEFAAYFALALAVLAASFERSLGWALSRLFKRPLGAVTAFTTLGLFLLVPLLMLPDAVSVLSYGQHTGFRYNEKGNPIRQDLDKTAALKWIKTQAEGRAVVEIHSSMETNWGQLWALHRPAVQIGKVGAGARKGRYLVADGRELPVADQQLLAKTYKVVVIGYFWFVDYEAPHGLIEGNAIAAEKPGLLSRYLIAPVDPKYEVRADDFWTWELRDHFLQEPNPAPTGAAQTASQRRIAHNLAVARGDVALAERLRSEIVGELDRKTAMVLSDGSEILGGHHDQLRNELWLYLRAAGATEATQSFSVRSNVVAKKGLSLIGIDEIERRTKGSFEIDSTLWKKDYVYVIRTEIRKRLGRETFEGYFSTNRGTPLRPKSGGMRFPLLELD